MQVQATRSTVQRQLTILSEAGYVDARTMTIQSWLLTWNSVKRTFGIAKFNMRQTQVGTFALDVLVTAINAAWPVNTWSGLKAVVLPLLTALLALVSCHQAATAAFRALKAQRGHQEVRRSLTGCMIACTQTCARFGSNAHSSAAAGICASAHHASTTNNAAQAEAMRVLW